MKGWRNFQESAAACRDFQDSHDAMRSLMWHNDQKSVCALVLAIVNEAQTL